MKINKKCLKIKNFNKHSRECRGIAKILENGEVILHVRRQSGQLRRQLLQPLPGNSATALHNGIIPLPQLSQRLVSPRRLFRWQR